MERGGRDWRIRSDLVVALKLTDSADDAVNYVSALWGPKNQPRVHSIWREHVKPKYLHCVRKQKRAQERGEYIAHPFAAIA